MLFTQFEMLMVQRAMGTQAQLCLLPEPFKPDVSWPAGRKEADVAGKYIKLGLDLSLPQRIDQVRLLSILMISSAFRHKSQLETALSSGDVTVIDEVPKSWCDEVATALRHLTAHFGKVLTVSDLRRLSSKSFDTTEWAVAVIDLEAATKEFSARELALAFNATLACCVPIILVKSKRLELPEELSRALPCRLFVAGRPDGAILQRAVKILCGAVLPSSLHIGRELEPSQVALALRPGLNANEILRLLREVSGTSDPVAGAPPTISDLCGMGGLKDWAEALAFDVAAIRAGELEMAQLSRGALVSSAPGVGKTFSAKIIAAHAGIPVIVASVARWLSHKDGHLGSFCSAVRSSFERALEQAPCLLVLDELDAMPSRDGSDYRDRTWWSSALTAVLECMDGIDDRSGVVVMGLCNYPDRLDPALVRAGRFDAHISIGLPTVDDLSSLLSICARPDLSGIDMRTIAVQLLGSTAADVARVVKDARRAARRTGMPLSLEHIQSVVLAGHSTVNLAALRRTAIHEAGHGLAAVLNGFAVDAVTINPASDPSSSSAGTTHVDFKGVWSGTWAELDAKVRVFLGGRAAEHVLLNSVSAGASDDLTRATALLVKAFNSGMGDTLSDARLLSGTPEFGSHVEERLQRLFGEVVAQLSAQAPLLETLAQELERTRYLDGAAFNRNISVTAWARLTGSTVEAANGV